MLFFCKCCKLTYHLTAEMQVAVGCMVIKDVRYSIVKNLLKHTVAEAVYGRSLTHLDLYPEGSQYS